MENNNYNNEVLATVETTKEKRTCKCCGKELPIDSFYKVGNGHRTVCISCLRANNGVSDRFKNFTSRELMEELRSRGFKGTLKYIRVETINI